MTWKDSLVPQPPTLHPLKLNGTNVDLTWDFTPGDEGNVYFNIYRSSSPLIDANDVKEFLFVTGQMSMRSSTRPPKVKAGITPSLR